MSSSNFEPIADISGAKVGGSAAHGDVVPEGQKVARPRNRRDIDGLRAIAVLSVLLFHARVPYFSGGFVGVDIFFVISGYLITAILYREMAGDRFSLITFYGRRVRRIIPALLATMAAVLALSWFLFLPKDLADTGQGLAATSLFASNFLFYFKTTYFGPAAGNMPLLHTWSLAVEEQFYIFFPLFLLLAMKLARRHALAIVFVAAAASLAISGWLAFRHPTEAFYFPVSRAWELLLGSLLSMSVQTKAIPKSSSQVLATTGGALVVGSVVLIGSATPFPGFAAFPVCFGTALIIYAGTGGATTLVARLLELRFFVFTGLISYSLYLWHWPALVFARYWLIDPPSAPAIACILAASYLLAAASWRWIEQPVRHGKILRNQNALFAAGFVGLAGIAAVGAIIVLRGGFPGRVPAEVAKLDSIRFADRGSGCPRAPGATYGSMCKIGNGRISFVVWGDSHAGAIWPAFVEAAERPRRQRSALHRKRMRSARGPSTEAARQAAK